ncbi:hypothetical protein ACEWY4_016019 [Coilia grayii]|uniref:Rab-GAP TBC domain-containing protein n=1 Tax=Coilia grayii TaxID=363190 RepID=A0ABD1JQK2_9TELE
MGLVGQQAASRSSPGQRSPLNISLKHPIIEFQNLCLRGKSVSQLDQVPVTNLQLDTPTQDKGNQITVSLDTPPQDTANQETLSLGTPTQDTANPATVSLNTPTQDIANQATVSLNTANQETVSLDKHTQDTANQETVSLDTPTQDTANHETLCLDTPTQDTANHETVCLDTPTQDTANHETAVQNTHTYDAASKNTACLDTPTQANHETISLDMPACCPANKETDCLTTTTHDTANKKTMSLDTPRHESANPKTAFISTSSDAANKERQVTLIYETANQETALLDTFSQDTANQKLDSLETPSENTTNQDTAPQHKSLNEAVNQETASLPTSPHNSSLNMPPQEIANQQTASLDTPPKEIANQQTASLDTPSKDAANQQAVSKDMPSKEIANQQTASLGIPSKEIANKQTASLDTPSKDAAIQQAASLHTPPKKIPNQQTASLVTPAKESANQRSGFLTLPAQNRSGGPRGPFSSLRAQRRTKGLSALLPPDHPGPDRTARLQLQLDALEQELRKQEELVMSLYRALEASQREKRVCAEYLSVSGEAGRLEVLRHRERLVAKLQEEGEELQQRLCERDAQVCELQESVQLLLQKNQAKQEVVLKLSQQLADWAINTHTHTHTQAKHTHTADTHTPAGHSHTRAGDTHTAGRPEEKEAYLKQKMRHLMDDLDAYRTQNKFLNSEIHHLTELWRQSSQQEKSLMFKCAYLEACSCQKESRYLGLLQQLRESVSSGAHTDPHTHTLRSLIDDALQGALSLSPTREFDAYGFKLVPDYEASDVQLLMRLNALELRSRSLLQQDEDRPLVSRWAQLLSSPAPSPTHSPLSHAHTTLSPSPELKALLRGGVPREFRARVWRWLVCVRTRSVRERHPDRYRLLTQRSQSAATAAAAHQIQLDLHRTLTTNQRFSSPSSPAHEQLRRVLLAFSCHNPSVGYCQGLNRLAALALLVLEEEEEAFWCLVAIVEAIMPSDYYTPSLLGYQVDQCVFGELLSAKVGRVSAHLQAHSVDVAQVSVSWFPSLFVELLPTDILLPLWDAFLYEGSKVIFRYALALLKYKEEEIVKLTDTADIFQYLFFFPKTITDVGRLRSVAFGEFNPLSKKHLRSRRAWHRQRLEAELRAREAELVEQSSQHAERHDKALDDVASDDDELN